MKKYISIIKTEQFWRWFVGSAVGIFALETFLLGIWSIPFVGYAIPYMEEITSFDLLFAGAFAIVFAYGLALFVLSKKYNAASCAVGSASGGLALFTMLCPVCPVFFLSYLGLSASVMVFAPYVWWIRLLSFVFLAFGIGLLLRRFEPRNLPVENGHVIFRKVAVVLVGFLLVGNQALALQLGATMAGMNHMGGVALSGDFAKDVAALVVPAEMPFYGQELGLDMSSLNAINASIRVLGTMAPMQGANPIALNPEEMKRYIDIGTEPYITCEFCCGVKTLVRKDGSPTCGCAHSIAMRGTAAYLIRNYPEMTNADIAYELMRQKGLYFPTQMQERMASALAGEPEAFTPDIKYLAMRLSEDELKDLREKAASSGFEPNQEAPGMVGGC